MPSTAQTPRLVVHNFGDFPYRCQSSLLGWCVNPQTEAIELVAELKSDLATKAEGADDVEQEEHPKGVVAKSIAEVCVPPQGQSGPYFTLEQCDSCIRAAGESQPPTQTIITEAAHWHRLVRNVFERLSRTRARIGSSLASYPSTRDRESDKSPAIDSEADYTEDPDTFQDFQTDVMDVLMDYAKFKCRKACSLLISQLCNHQPSQRSTRLTHRSTSNQKHESEAAKRLQMPPSGAISHQEGALRIMRSLIESMEEFYSERDKVGGRFGEERLRMAKDGLDRIMSRAKMADCLYDKTAKELQEEVERVDNCTEDSLNADDDSWKERAKQLIEEEELEKAAGEAKGPSQARTKGASLSKSQRKRKKANQKNAKERGEEGQGDRDGGKSLEHVSGAEESDPGSLSNSIRRIVTDWTEDVGGTSTAGTTHLASTSRVDEMKGDWESIDTVLSGTRPWEEVGRRRIGKVDEQHMGGYRGEATHDGSGGNKKHGRRMPDGSTLYNQRRGQNNSKTTHSSLIRDSLVREEDESALAGASKDSKFIEGGGRKGRRSARKPTTRHTAMLTGPLAQRSPPKATGNQGTDSRFAESVRHVPSEPPKESPWNRLDAAEKASKSPTSTVKVEDIGHGLAAEQEIFIDPSDLRMGMHDGNDTVASAHDVEQLLDYESETLCQESEEDDDRLPWIGSTRMATADRGYRSA